MTQKVYTKKISHLALEKSTLYYITSLVCAKNTEIQDGFTRIRKTNSLLLMPIYDAGPISLKVIKRKTIRRSSFYIVQIEAIKSMEI